MKRLAALLMAGSILVTPLVGCGGSPSPPYTCPPGYNLTPGAEENLPPGGQWAPPVITGPHGEACAPG